VYRSFSGGHIPKGLQIVNEKDTEEKFLRVSAGSNAQSVGSAIAHALYESPQIKLRAVGASAVNQAVKAIAIARGYVAPRGLDLSCRPGFTTVESRDGSISAIVFTISVN
jgi:stage V sporulation protein S